MNDEAHARVDRTGWPPGPWDREPDRVEFTSHGFAGLLNRNHFGAWCGYVGVPKSHPAYGKSDNEIEVDVHGGLTYAARCDGPICHTPQPGMPDEVWWLGFDLMHCWDLAPRLMPSSGAEVYRDMAFARAETERLAAQLAELERTPDNAPQPAVAQPTAIVRPTQERLYEGGSVDDYPD